MADKTFTLAELDDGFVVAIEISFRWRFRRTDPNRSRSSY
jgi:hypothetical protein